MQIIGHRGAKGLAPENTVKGISLALKQKVDWIEFDVRLTKDKALVVLHDRTLLRITKERGRVKHYTLAEIQTMATRSGEPVPTFHEVCKAIGNRAKLDIELKEKGCAKQVAAEIKRQVTSGRPYSDFIVSSFKPQVLQEVQRIDSRIPLLLLQAAWPFLFVILPHLRLTGVGFSRFAAPRLAIRLAKKRKLWTIVYTINSQEAAQFFKLRGIDALVTDVPHAFQPAWPWFIRWAIVLTLMVIVVVLLNYALRL